MALVMYGRQEEADTLIEQLILDKDALLRYGGMYAIALAYCGTGSAAAIRRLLHEAVSDVSDDVRRAAVTAIGFVLARQPQQCPHLVSLLTDSYNPHVRYNFFLPLDDWSDMVLLLRLEFLVLEQRFLKQLIYWSQ